MASTPIYPRNTEADDVLFNGDKAVAVAGTAEALVSVATPCYEVTIQAKSTNTDKIFIGGENVPNDETGGVFLTGGQSITLTPIDLQQIFVNSVVNGEGVSFIYWTAVAGL